MLPNVAALHWWLTVVYIQGYFFFFLRFRISLASDVLDNELVYLRRWQCRPRGTAACTRDPLLRDTQIGDDRTPCGLPAPPGHKYRIFSNVVIIRTVCKKTYVLNFIIHINK